MIGSFLQFINQFDTLLFTVFILTTTHFAPISYILFLTHFLFRVSPRIRFTFVWWFFCLLVHLRVRINLPRQFILFIWITFADDPFVISIFIILYNSLSNWVFIYNYDPLTSAILFELLIHLFLQDFFKTLIHLAI